MKIRQLDWLALSLVAVCLLGVCGCRTSVRTTDTAETGSQQLLLNSSFDAVVQSIDMHELAGRPAFLDTSGLGSANQGYLAYRIREQMGAYDVPLVATREEAEIIVEAGLSAYGTDSNSSVLGITETDQLPELNVWTRDTQFGVSQLSMFAHERESGRLIWQAGPIRSDSYQNIEKVLGLGPFYSGTIVHPAESSGWTQRKQCR